MGRLALLSMPWFWRVRHHSRRLQLRGDAALYRTRGGVSRAGKSMSTLGGLVRGGGAAGAVALVVTVAVEVLAHLLRTRDVDGRFVGTVASGEYEPLLLGVAGFGATLLGLYFTALTVVISTTYARAPSSVRGLVAQDEAGTTFARLVAGLVVVSVTLVTAGLFGYDAAGVTLVLVGAVTGVSILALLRLSVRTLSFFDPVRLSPPLLDAFRRWTRSAAAGGPRWRTPAYQDAYRRLAQDVLRTVRDLIGFTAEVERADISDVRSLGQQVLRLWARYASDKTSVPVDSRWFERKYEHPDWFTESATNLHLALATDVGLSAKVREYGDAAWAERQMADSVSACVRELLEGRHREGVAGLVETASQLARELGRHAQVAEAKLLCEAVSAAWRDLTDAQDTDDATQLGAAPAEALAVVDVLCLLPINLLLGFVDRCSEMGATTFTKDVDLALARPRGPFASNLPIDVVTQLDQLKAGLDFEREVEGRQVTPDWWLHHMAARHTLSALNEALDLIVDLIESGIVSRAEDLVSAAMPYPAAVVASRGLEASHKLSVHLHAIEVAFDQLVELRVVDDQFWPAVDLARPRRVADELLNRSVDVFARVTPVLGVSERDETLPDLFGHGHAVLVRETFAAILKGNPDRFDELWPKVFASGLLAYERTRRSLAGHHNQETAAIYVSELLADLFELSGYALARSELDGGRYWDTCKERWDQLFAGTEDPEAMADMMMAFTRLREGAFGILPRATIRTGREQMFRSMMADLGLVSDSALDFDHTVDHPSPILRAYGRRPLGLNDAVTLFVAEFLSALPGAGEPPQDVKSLIAELAQERSEGGGPP